MARRISRTKSYAGSLAYRLTRERGHEKVVRGSGARRVSAMTRRPCLTGPSWWRRRRILPRLFAAAANIFCPPWTRSALACRAPVLVPVCACECTCSFTARSKACHTPPLLSTALTVNRTGTLANRLERRQSPLLSPAHRVWGSIRSHALNLVVLPCGPFTFSLPCAISIHGRVPHELLSNIHVSTHGCPGMQGCPSVSLDVGVRGAFLLV